MFKTIILLAFPAIAIAQVDPSSLVQRLANPSGIEDVELTAEMEPALLEIAAHPPANLSPFQKFQLPLGLAEAFGKLRSQRAIPYLIEHISQKPIGAGNIWMKEDSAIESRMPAIDALIQIGGESCRTISARRFDVTSEDYLAAVFVVARIRCDAGKEFLRSAARLGGYVGGMTGVEKERQ